MDPTTISALIGAATSAIQGIAGGFQLNKARRLERENPRPTAETSDTIKRLLGYSYARTMDQDIPGGQIYRNEIKGATAAGISAAKQLGSGSEAYGMLGQLVGREQGAMSELAKATAQQQYNAQGQYMDVLQGPAYQEERRVDYWNKEMPYLQAARMAQQLRMSGSQNIMAGVKNIAGMGTAMLGSGESDLSSALGGRGASTGVNMSPEDLNKLIDQISSTVSRGNNGGTSNSNSNIELALSKILPYISYR